VLSCRFHAPDEDFESARKAYEWPKKFVEVLREAGTKAASEHRQFEAALKLRRKEFDQQVQQHAEKLTIVEARSDIFKREVAAAEVWGVCMCVWRGNRGQGYPAGVTVLLPFENI
jgi:dynein heavy chain